MSIRIGGDNILTSVVCQEHWNSVWSHNDDGGPSQPDHKVLYLWAISKIRTYLTTDDAEKLIYAFVTSRLDCNSSFLYGIADYIMDKLQLIQNDAAMVITQTRKHEHITPTLISLHWLPVQYHIQYKVLMLAFKSQNSKVDLLEPYIPITSLWSDQQHTLAQPTTGTKKYGNRAFSTCAPSYEMYRKRWQFQNSFEDIFI